MKTLVTLAQRHRDRILGRHQAQHMTSHLYVVTHSWGPSRQRITFVEAPSRREACRIVREQAHVDGYPHVFRAKRARFS